MAGFDADRDLFLKFVWFLPATLIRQLPYRGIFCDASVGQEEVDSS